MTTNLDPKAGTTGSEGDLMLVAVLREAAIMAAKKNGLPEELLETAKILSANPALLMKPMDDNDESSLSSIGNEGEETSCPSTMMTSSDQTMEDTMEDDSNLTATNTTDHA
jgi:hypothetical protein